MPKVSVILPTYNRARTLPRAMNSILAQTFKDIELIIVDDGSTDDTTDLLQKYVTKDSRIKIITQENQGLAIARNNGVEKGSGKYIAFMDSDDACAINRIEVQLNFLLQNPEYPACGLYNLMSIADYYPGVYVATCDKNQIYSDNSPFQSKKNLPVLGAYSLMTKDSFLRIGGYRTQSTIIEDLDFTLRYNNYYTWGCIYEACYFYDAPSTNSAVGLVNSDVHTFAKRIISCYLSEWCRFSNMQDPVEEGKSLIDILAIKNVVPIKDRAIIYNNIRYFRHTLSAIDSMTNKESKKYLMSILSDNTIDRWLINFWFKLL